MKIKILAFATAAEALGTRELELEVEPGTSVAMLLEQLEDRAAALAPIRDRLAVAVNGELATADTVLPERAEVALLPPVSGGDPTPAVQLVARPIEAGELALGDPSCGAEVLFVGRVRDQSGGRGVTKIDYQGYETMAEARLEGICRDLSRSGVQVRIIHRLGEVPAGEISVAIAARAPHRREAFAACRETLERLKRETPIWKLEHYDDGSVAWREEEPLAGTSLPSSTA